MNNVSRTVTAHALMALATCASALAQVPEARFLPFGEELRRARNAIGPEAECRVIVEEVLARCELRVAGGHAHPNSLCGCAPLECFRGNP